MTDPVTAGVATDASGDEVRSAGTRGRRQESSASAEAIDMKYRATLAASTRAPPAMRHPQLANVSRSGSRGRQPSSSTHSACRSPAEVSRGRSPPPREVLAARWSGAAHGVRAGRAGRTWTAARPDTILQRFPRAQANSAADFTSRAISPHPGGGKRKGVNNLQYSSRKFRL